ncbi:MAG: hypothetical protein C4341_06095 [Armatimonadota bacterium]
MTKDYYKTLGLKRDAEVSEVRAAYRRLARSLHPDVNKSPDAGERMSEVNEAYAVLGDPERRAAYDAKCRRGTGAPMPERATLNVVVERAYTVVDFRSPLYAVAVSGNGRSVAVGSFDNRVRILRARDGEALGEVFLPGGAIEAIQWVGKDAFVVAGASEKTFATWVVRDGVATRWKGKRAEWVSHLDISPDGKRLALGSVHRTLMVVDARTGAQLYMRRRHRDAISAVRYSPDGTLLASGANDHRVVLYEAKHGLEIAHFGPFPTAIGSIAFNAENTLLAIGLIDHGVRVIRLGDGTVAATLRGHTRPIECIEFHPTRNLLATASRDGTVRLWDAASGKASLVLGKAEAPVKSVAFSPSGQRIFAGGLDRKLHVWRVSPKSHAGPAHYQR